MVTGLIYLSGRDKIGRANIFKTPTMHLEKRQGGGEEERERYFSTACLYKLCSCSPLPSAHWFYVYNI